MSLFITSLNSGSSGNCYYIGNETEAILVDVGICCSEIEKRMKRLNLCLQKVKAIFISHEHTDHINGLCVLHKKYQLPVYITNATHRFSKLKLEKHLVSTFVMHQPVAIGNLSVTAFPKFHDAADPCSFMVSYKEVNVGIFTDIGSSCENVIHHFKQCHAAFLEANYDDTLLQQSNYPYFLKSRIAGEKGHLSNNQALQLFKSHRSPFISHLFLSHLSKNNNCPKLVEKLFNQHANGVKMIIASRYQETQVFQIQSSTKDVLLKNYVPLQLSLSFA